MRFVRLLLSHGFIGCALAFVLVAGTVWEGGPLHTAESRVFDHFLRLNERPAGPRVVLAAIGKESLARVGSWPWPRALVAQGLRRLSSAGARAIGLQLRYPGPELNPGLQEVRELRGRVHEGPGPEQEMAVLLAEAEARLDGDAALVSAVAEGRTLLPVGLGAGVGSPGATSRVAALGPYLLAVSPAPTGWRQRLLQLRNPFLGSPRTVPPGELELPASPLVQPASALGHVSWFSDSDGVTRRELLLLPTQGGYLPSLALQLAAYASSPPTTLRVVGEGNEPGTLYLGSSPLPADEQFRLLLDARGSPDRIEFAQLLDGEFSPALVRDRIVVVGLAAQGYAASYTVPGGGHVSGAELLALATENILAARHPVRPPWAWALEVGFLVYLGLFVAFLAPRVSLRVGAAAVLLFLVAWGGVGAYLAGVHGIWLKTLAPLLLGLSGFGLVAVRRLAAAGESRGETAELNRMLGLTFQGQGQLDLAFEKFVRCPIRDPSVRELLYNLGLDFERKRMANKAAAVYRHILKAGAFRDAAKRVTRLEAPERTLVLGAGPASTESTLVLEPGGTAPTLGRYEIVRELGQGAMGTVYLGRDPKINREVAIKTLRFGEVGDGDLPEIKRRFFREAEAAGRLKHPGIVTIYDAGEDHDLAYLAMEYLEGRDLTGYCARDNLLPVGKALDVAASVADALAYAHRHGVVHRDVKPANIMLLPDGQVKVTDFGIARVLANTATQTGVVLGTPSYMSPEQVAGRKVDGRSDLFSLGVVLYELLSGERPFRGENLAALMYQITKGEYPHLRDVRRGLPNCCVAIVDGLLVRAVSRRVKSADEVADQIRTCRKAMR